MLLANKKIVIMGIRNKWSIAWGTALSAAQNGAEVIFTYSSLENKEKIEELISEIPNAIAYTCNVNTDEEIQNAFEMIKKKHGKIDGILHSIAHANTNDLRNDFINTSREGFKHAAEVSAYSLVAVCRIAKELDILNKDASIVTFSYYGSTKVLPGYNVMGIAKAALESSVRYLAQNLGEIGVRVNAVSAGPIKTLSAKGIKDFSSILEIVEQRAPLKRNVTIREVGDTATFLFSNMSRAITGQVIYADSGYEIMGL